MFLREVRESWRSALIAAALGALLGLATSAVATSDPQPPDEGEPNEEPSGSGGPGTYAAEVVTPGPGLSADVAIERVLGGLSETDVSSARLIPAGLGSRSGAPWISVRLDSDFGDHVETVWHGQLVHGAVADLMRTDELTTKAVLGGAQIEVGDATGDEIEAPLGVGSVTGGQHFNSSSDEEVRAWVQTVANDFGLELSSIAVLHPLESALSVRFIFPAHGKVAWTLFELQMALEGSPTSLEGVFIELASPDGGPMLRTGAAYRVGGGGSWFAPGQDERFGVVRRYLAPPDPSDARD